MAQPKPARDRRVTLLVATRKGLWQLHADPARRSLARRGAAIPGAHRPSLRCRSAQPGTMLAAARTGHLGPTVFRSTDRGRTWHEAVKPPAFDENSDANRRSHVLAHARTRVAAGRVVRRHVAAGTVPFRRRRRDVARRGGLQRQPAAQGVVRRRQGRNPRRTEAALGQHRPARRGAHVHRHVERRRVRVDRRRRRTGRRSTRGSAPISCPIPTPSTGTIRIACACIRRCPTGCISRITAASIGSIARRGSGRTSARPCPRASDRSASRSSCIRAIRRRYGFSRWMAAASGRASRRAASRRCTERVNGGKTWQRQATGLPKAQAWYTVKRQAMSVDQATPAGVYFGTTSGDVWASRDEGRTWKRAAAASSRDLRRRSRVSAKDHACTCAFPARCAATPTTPIGSTHPARRCREVLADLDRQYPGIRFRVIDEHGGIRRHIKFFVNGLQADDLAASVAASDEVMIVCALSGG